MWGMRCLRCPGDLPQRCHSGKCCVMTARKQIFISSVQKELADERRALKEYVHGDPLLRRFFEVFLFEDLPASDRRADEVYLHEVEQSAI